MLNLFSGKPGVDAIFKKYLSIFILAAGVCCALIFGMDFKSIGLWSLRTLYEKQTVELFFVIYLVLLLGEIMAEKKSLGRIVRGLAGMLKKKPLMIAFAPAFIGLLPMPGGALVSAPILDETLGKTHISPAVKTFTNFWFRHIWEYAWPLYPALILTSAIFNVRVIDVIKVMFYFTLIAAALGALSIKLYFPRFKEDLPSGGTFWQNIKTFSIGSWEILMVVLLIIILKVSILAALGLVIMLSLLFIKAAGLKKILLLKRAFKVQVLAVLIAVMVFKNLVLHSEMTSMIESLVRHADAYRLLIMFIIPFMVGFLTGFNQAYAGIGFPILIPVVGIENPDLNMIAFLYISGFAGVLLSPVHLCLVLSSEYYGANLAKVYKFLIPPIIAMMLLAATIYGSRI